MVDLRPTTERQRQMSVLTKRQPWLNHSQVGPQVQPQEALATGIFRKSPWQLHMQERLITSKALQQAGYSQNLGSGAQSIQSERSVPPIPVVCQCKCSDDQGCRPVLPTRTAVVARLEKRGRRGVSFCDRALRSACDVKRQKKHFWERAWK